MADELDPRDFPALLGMLADRIGDRLPDFEHAPDLLLAVSDWVAARSIDEPGGREEPDVFGRALLVGLYEVLLPELVRTGLARGWPVGGWLRVSVYHTRGMRVFERCPVCNSVELDWRASPSPIHTVQDVELGEIPLRIGRGAIIRTFAGPCRRCRTILWGIPGRPPR
jgi:hypothetical protein